MYRRHGTHAPDKAYTASFYYHEKTKESDGRSQLSLGIYGDPRIAAVAHDAVRVAAGQDTVNCTDKEYVTLMRRLFWGLDAETLSLQLRDERCRKFGVYWYRVRCVARLFFKESAEPPSTRARGAERCKPSTSNNIAPRCTDNFNPTSMKEKLPSACSSPAMTTREFFEHCGVENDDDFGKMWTDEFEKL